MSIIKEGYFKGQYLPDKNKNQIVKDKEKFHIWSDGGGDPFQCRICVENITFCPVCGRKL